ncbi:MAG: NAD-dependent epimerase/dehydratase family protein [Candidatus Thermoplasmatota archaeon]|jgi:UDP-glucuronate decarboxylase|nr:NAD-dependent epimerase/dehydratase family protein [Candidatus Thermoplasmatota archaeon]MCL5789178.1 NAD-dependent epimerase/dehydratase family protein [Candidatus Thermoplasmatota archaeon]
MKRVLISGGNGFLGSHLVRESLARGFEVTVVDDMSTSNQMNVPHEVKFVGKRIEDFSTNERFDYVVHLAARPSPDDYVKHPVDTMLSNSIGTKNTLEIALKSNATFMFTSSSEVYGDAAVIPTPETYYGYVNPNGIRSCYDEGKRFSEALIMSYHREYGLDTRIQRPFNVYGSGIREDGAYGRVIPRFIDWSLRGERIIVHGDGKQTRSFLYVDDWLEATWEFLTKDGLSGDVINIGSEKEITIVQLAQKIKGLIGSSSEIFYDIARENDPRRRAADITLAKEKLDWEPNISLDEGLVKTIEWFRRRMR